jgi:ribosomal protein L37AE/L43A
MVDYIPDAESVNAFTEWMSTLIKSTHAEQFVACPGQNCRYCEVSLVRYRRGIWRCQGCLVMD